ncbi:uncharacterized protein Dwil_GK20696 [Drosophila willistoni]|uniref:Uncharacterized protein n=1 Tax=Drosophila willistoni TaxID=7260 RepID=B4MXX3_DROWI|nr:uncharacterized protein LOC6642973 [Drosophila willistoni]EDW76892.1 uncharacterized protein Dwil_GK20696 [Drosophila willistoni]
MHWPSIICMLILIIYSITIRAQRNDCSRLRQRCEPCARRLTDPVNNLESINRNCRAWISDTWIWRDVNRCDMQIIACENHDRKLDCETVALLAGMRRRRRDN